jgi:hypothetical protein
MRQTTDDRRTARADAGRGRADRVPDRVVAALVDRGLVQPDRAGEAHEVVTSALSGPTAADTPLRRRLAEVAGYVGGALVVAAAVVFLSEQWASLSTTGRVSTLAVIGVVLFGAALVVLRTGGAEGETDSGVRRRLASALTSGSAATLGFGAGVLVDAQARDLSNLPLLVGSVVALAVAVGGYLLAHSALGQLAMAVGAVSALSAVVDSAASMFEGSLGLSELPFAFTLAALGIVWLALAERHVFWERNVGLSTGCVLVLYGAQYPVLTSVTPWVGYLMTAVLAAAGVWLYVRSRALPYLVTAVAAITLVVPEALLNWTEGSLGTAGMLLATGVTLLVASLLGLRLRQEIGGPAGPGATV